MNFNTDDGLWCNEPHLGTHSSYPVLLLVEGDVHVCSTNTPDARLRRCHYGDHIARFTDQTHARETLERCGWLVCQHTHDVNTCIAYSTTKYQRDDQGAIVLKEGTKP